MQILAQARSAAKVVGLSEEQYQKALNDAKIEFETGMAPQSSYDDSAACAALLNYIVVALIFAAAVWVINKDYGNAATKFFVAYFPRESRTLGIQYPRT